MRGHDELMNPVYDPLPPDITPELKAVMASAVQNRASDIHIKAGKPPMLRIDGSLRELDVPPLDFHTVHQDLSSLCISAGFGELPAKETQIDFPFHLIGTGRFRCHLFRQRGGWAGLLRVIPEDIPGFDDLRLPTVVKTINDIDRGIVLVTGATGMGKSTTCASILAEMAETKPLHILTIEDPIEFIIPETRASVSQRNVGIDVGSYREALESAFREDPDVLFIDELRTQQAVEVALHAGESGHLCMSTIHTTDVVGTIRRIGSMVPDDFRKNVLGRLAESLRIIISQRLVPMAGRAGRILVAEVMVTTPSIKEAIRDPSKHKTIPALINREGSGSHCQAFDQHLLVLLRNKLITLDTAKAAASSPSDLVRALRLG
jgi:twitching motility protein PilT